MKRTGLLYDDRYQNHLTGPYHPEMPERLKCCWAGIEAGGLLPQLTLIRAQTADFSWIEAVHDPNYVRRFEEACLSGKSDLDYPDNQMCPDTFETALLAVGGILKAIDLMMEGQIDNAFCAVRPPGHHAEYDQAMGFCYFNNVAVAARYLQKKWGIQRVGIIDFDVHHGNGTQHLFEKDPSVFYYSIHEHPTFLFPGTGRVFEKGAEAGVGFTRNYPVLPGQGDPEYAKAMREDFWPAFDQFAPEVILVSAGFDAHEDDDMADVKLTTGGFTEVMKTILQMASRHAQGRVISVLEGGYCLERLPELIRNHVSLLLNQDALAQ